MTAAAKRSPPKAKTEAAPHVPPRRVSHALWLEEGRARFGPDPDRWAFVCPVCGHIQTIAQLRAAGAPEGTWAFSCIGRSLPKATEAFTRGKPGPCTYAGGGLFRLNPVEVEIEAGEIRQTFEWAPATSDEASPEDAT